MGAFINDIVPENAPPSTLLRRRLTAARAACWVNRGRGARDKAPREGRDGRLRTRLLAAHF